MMPTKKGLFLLAAMLLFAGGTMRAQTTIPASTDVWLRESGADRTFENDLVSVWSASGNDGARRYGVIEFDVSSLSGIALENATLRLWADANGFSDDSKPIKQSAVAIDTSGGTDAASMTWAAFTNEFEANAQPLSGLGRVDFAPAGPEDLGVFVESSADDADLGVIEAAVTGNGRLTLVLIADEDGTDYAKSWGDGPDGFGGMKAELVVNRPTMAAPALGGWGQLFLVATLLLAGGLVLLRRRRLADGGEPLPAAG